VYQEYNHTTIVEQPLDFTTLSEKYDQFVTSFLQNQTSDEPFFLYVPFSHVHVTSASQPERQYAGCRFQNSTLRGKYGDALKEADDMVGTIFATLKEQNLLHNTLILFTSDNGPWLSRYVMTWGVGNTGILYL
jgi:arylsulfatase A-like enzyme